MILMAIKGNYCVEYATIEGQSAAALGPESAWMPVLANKFRRQDDTYQNVMADVKEQVAQEGYQSIDNLVSKFKLYYYMPKFETSIFLGTCSTIMHHTCV